MEKILKKYTTIPEHLYVERNADIQLRNIIKEMQRPGYVLVARQMGKTNLLFNAKRTLENEERLFVYVDLSNLYENERECYRNIINNIIEPNLDLFEYIENDVEIIREKELAPHNEYSRSLRLVLNHFNGDLVIILDEIDALKSVDYSDNIFAQIRSNYFSRTNFPVFERLTYVLSGVIEPTELIKDRNKSPFNIGDKIYLDDFTKEEHDVFITKSKLNITNDISDQIFNWTNGNPRLTFDICSEIEDEITATKLFTSEKLNTIIKKKYLTNFDIAPIDHIRELVKTNKSIRKSIIQIHNKKTSEISDDSKKKLYLYGIINSKFNEETEIKNKIIEQSLSEEWVKSIDKEKEISFVYGVAKYSSKEYEEAIEIFENVLIDIKSTKNDIEASSYFIGLCYFRLGNYKKAILYFENEFQNETYSIDTKSFLGICKIATDEKDEGIRILKESIRNESNNYAYHTAVLNLAINTEDDIEALNLFEKLFDSTFKSVNEDEKELNQLRTLSLFYQGEIWIAKGNQPTALEYINKALEYSEIIDSLYLNFLKYNFSEVKDESIKVDIINNIITNKLRFSTQNLTPISFTERALKYFLNLVFDFNDSKYFESLLNYSIEELIPELTKFELVYEVSTISTKKREQLLHYILKFKDEIEDALLIKTYKDLAINNGSNFENYFTYFEKYKPLFNKSGAIKINDIFLFAVGIKLFSDSGNIKEALDLCFTIHNKIQNTNDENLKFESAIIYYWYTNLYRSINDVNNTLKYANIALELLDSHNRKKSSMLDEEGINKIREQLVSIRRSITNPSNLLRSTIRSKKYNRNDIVKVKYLDDSIVTKKYKQIEPDLKSGKCQII